MNQFRLSIRLNGIICLLLSVIHVPWLWSLGDYAIVSPMSEAQLLSFQLFSTAVIMFLAYMGCNAIVLTLADSLSPAALRVFSSLILAFFVVRLLVEFVFPLQIPLLGVEQPTTMVRILLCVPISVALFPFLYQPR